MPESQKKVKKFVAIWIYKFNSASPPTRQNYDLKVISRRNIEITGTSQSFG